MKSQPELLFGKRRCSCRLYRLVSVAWRALVSLALLSMAISRAASNDSSSPAEKSCNPGPYCARTDRRVEPYPRDPLPIGAAGSTVIDPNFGSRILRLTDANTDAKRPSQNFQSPASAQQNNWNTASTNFYVVEAGGNFLIYDFDPAKMTARLRGNPDLKWRAEPQFSYSKPNLLYGIITGSPEFQQYDLTNGKITILHKPAGCVKLDSSDRGFDPSVSADDNRFMAVIGPQQDKNYLVYVYDRQKGCRWLNTQTGEIGGQWGPKGITQSNHFLIHDARISKSGQFIAMVGAGQAPTIWELDTLNVTPCERRPPVACGGHHALGYSHMVNPAGARHPMELLVRPLNKVNAISNAVPDLEPTQGWYDKHFSWNNVDPQDTKPVCFSSYRPDNPDTPGTPPKVVGPWENEIDCLEMDGKGSRIWRFAHTYSTAKNGFWSTPRGNVSQDGRFFLFTSDWEDQLGKAPNGRQYRHDVFLVELR